jgi:hypothetical protein
MYSIIRAASNTAEKISHVLLSIQSTAGIPVGESHTIHLVEQRGRCGSEGENW